MDSMRAWSLSSGGLQYRTLTQRICLAHQVGLWPNFKLKVQFVDGFLKMVSVLVDLICSWVKYSDQWCSKSGMKCYDQLLSSAWDGGGGGIAMLLLRRLSLQTMSPVKDGSTHIQSFVFIFVQWEEVALGHPSLFMPVVQISTNLWSFLLHCHCKSWSPHYSYTFTFSIRDGVLVGQGLGSVGLHNMHRRVIWISVMRKRFILNA